MKYLTFLDYTTLESTGKNIEAKLQEKDDQIHRLREKYDTVYYSYADITYNGYDKKKTMN